MGNSSPKPSANGRVTFPAIQSSTDMMICIILVYLFTECPPVCAIFCKHGNVLDENGCPTCQCKKKGECDRQKADLFVS